MVGMSIPVSLGALLIVLFLMPACCLIMVFGVLSKIVHFISYLFYGVSTFLDGMAS